MATLTTTSPLWFFTPLQIATTVIAGMNCGASSLQSPLTWPMLQDTTIPAHYTGHQTELLLHGSEHLFPPFNAVCTLSNLILSGLTYAYYTSGPEAIEAEEKMPYCVAAFGLHVATTVYTLTVMAPWNEKLKVASRKMNKAVERGEEKSEGWVSAEKDFRDAQKQWKVLNYGRGLIMGAAAVANALALKA